MAHTLTRLSNRFEASHAFASACRQNPVAVAVAERLRLLNLSGISDTLALGVHDRRQLLAGRRLGEVSEVGDDVGTDQVVDLDGDERQASALVTEGEVDTLLGDRDAPYLGVDDNLKYVSCCWRG